MSLHHKRKNYLFLDSDPDFLGYCVSGNIRRWDNTIVIEDELLDGDIEEEVEEEKDNKETVARTPGFYNLEDHIVVRKARKRTK